MLFRMADLRSLEDWENVSWEFLCDENGFAMSPVFGYADEIAQEGVSKP
jgi:hypothetical protein